MDEVKLAACPFCGGEAEIVQIGNEATRKRGFEVRCLTWGCATKKRSMVIHYPLAGAREFVIKAWNTRTLSTDGAEERVATVARAIMACDFGENRSQAELYARAAIAAMNPTPTG